MALAAAFAVSAAAPAAADTPLRRGFSDGVALLRPPGGDHQRLLASMRAAGGSVVRIPANWNETLPGLPPADGANPTDPAYDFTRLDRAVRAAVAAGADVLIVVSHAPHYAEAAPRYRFAARGSWGVRPSALAAYAHALTVRYSGRFATADGVLPRVRLWQSWNEPNLPQYLAPQWTARAGHWIPWAPAHYRRMHNAFYRAVKAVQPDARVTSAGLAPIGEPTDGVGRMTPMRFLRAFLCLDAAGAPARPRCADPPLLDAVAFHPLSTGDPDRPAALASEVAIADIGKVTAAVRAARSAGIVRGAPELWITELNWTTGAGGVPSRLQAAWVGRALHRLWLAGASIVAWHFFTDRSTERPAGLLHADGSPKPLLRGWALPVDALRQSRAHVGIWAMPAQGAQRVCVEARPAGRRAWRRAGCRTVASADVPVQLRIALRGRGDVRVRSGGRTSAVRRVGT
ncbi:MAG: hypothetical protein JHC95_17285 [Solirubrobacteraceae bacterium]|nr:hypothetical protein [Solirubrobacteraceae bacterium]